MRDSQLRELLVLDVKRIRFWLKMFLEDPFTSTY